MGCEIDLVGSYFIIDVFVLISISMNTNDP